MLQSSFQVFVLLSASRHFDLVVVNDVKEANASHRTMSEEHHVRFGIGQSELAYLLDIPAPVLFFMEALLNVFLNADDVLFFSVSVKA